MKHKMKLLTAMLLLAIAIVFIPTGDRASAAASVIQTNAISNAVTVKWTPPTKSSSWTSFTINSYTVGCAQTREAAEKAAKNSTTKLSGTSTMTTIKNLSAGRTYYVYVYCQYTYTYSTGNTYTSNSLVGSAKCVTTPIAVSGLALEPSYTTNHSTLYFDWTPQSCADGYNYVVYSLSGKQLQTKTVSGYSGSYTNSANKGQAYKVRVRAYIKVNEGKKNIYGPWSNWIYMVPQPDINKAEVTSAKKLTLSWDKANGATSYEVFVSSTGRRSGYKKVATITNPSTTSTTIANFDGKSFDRDRTYFVYIRATKTIGGKTFYSDTSYRTLVY